MVLEVLSYLVTPSKRELITPVVHLAFINCGTLCTDGEVYSLRKLQEHITVPDAVSIKRYAQTLLEEAGVNTEVELIRLIPRNATVNG